MKPAPLALVGLLAAGCGDVTLVDNRGVTGILDVYLGEIAVVTGDNERIEEVLDEVEAEFTLFDGFSAGPPTDALLADRYAEALTPVEALFSSDTTLLAYDTLFLNCGVRGAGGVSPSSLEPVTTLLDSGAVRRNLRAFVAAGGVVYVADQSYGLIEAAIPEAFDFRGADAVVGAALQGSEGALTARGPLAERLGGAVEIPVGERWAMVHAVEGAWLTATAPLISGDTIRLIDGTPLLAARSFGDGLIVFSGFHNSAEVDQARTQLQIQLLRGMGGAL